MVWSHKARFTRATITPQRLFHQFRPTHKKKPYTLITSPNRISISGMPRNIPKNNLLWPHKIQIQKAIAELTFQKIFILQNGGVNGKRFMKQRVNRVTSHLMSSADADYEESGLPSSNDLTMYKKLTVVTDLLISLSLIDRKTENPVTSSYFSSPHDTSES